MKATGIVRRIDDLGRVVIPKEISRVMRIRDGDPLEIYTATDGEVIFKKYSPIGEMTSLAAQYAEVMAQDCAFGIAVCDRDRVVAAAGVSKRETVDRRISSELERLTEDRRIYIYKNGEKGFLLGEDMELSYRHSAYYDNDCVITGVYFKLKKSDKQEIKAKMDDFMLRRKTKQPLEYPSAGSTFKRPQGYFAGALIEECGLKGCSVGGAQVSTKHSGFVINTGSATCNDVLSLCKKVADTVKAQKGVDLEMEIRVTK